MDLDHPRGGQYTILDPMVGFSLSGEPLSAFVRGRPRMLGRTTLIGVCLSFVEAFPHHREVNHENPAELENTAKIIVVVWIV